MPDFRPHGAFVRLRMEPHVVCNGVRWRVTIRHPLADEVNLRRRIIATMVFQDMALKPVP